MISDETQGWYCRTDSYEQLSNDQLQPPQNWKSVKPVLWLINTSKTVLITLYTVSVVVTYNCRPKKKSKDFKP